MEISRTVEEDLQELNELSERRDRLLNELERFGEYTIVRLQAISKELNQFENVRNPDAWEEKYSREKMHIFHEEKRRVENENVDFLIEEIDRRFQEEFRYRIEEKQRKEQSKRDFDSTELKRTNQEDLVFMKRELQRVQLMESNRRRNLDSQPIFPPKFGFGMHSPKRIGAKPSSELIETALKDFERKYYGRFPSSPTIGRTNSNIPVLVISVDIGHGVHRNIEVFEHMKNTEDDIHSNSVELAVKFCKENHLNLEYVASIGKFIRNTVRQQFSISSIPNDTSSIGSSESDDDDFYSYGRASKLSPSMPVYPTKYSLRSPKGSPTHSPKGSPASKSYRN